MLIEDKNKSGESRLGGWKSNRVYNFFWTVSFFQPVDDKTEKLKDQLRALDINTLSPVEALLKPQELKLLMK